MNSGILKEFRDFIAQPNVLMAAVAFIMALAFTPVITALVDDVIMQILAAIFGEPNFDNIGFDLGDARVRIGAVITALVRFVAIAAGVFFLIVKPMQMIEARRKSGAEASPPPPEDIALLREIRDLLSRR
jgi:large conductance mechanosensitive channel